MTPIRAIREKEGLSGFERALEVFLVFFGSWTLFCWLLVFSGRNFHTLVWLAWIPVFATASIFRRPVIGEAPEAPSPVELSPPVLAGLLAAAGAIVALYRWTGSYLLFWFLAIFLLTVALRCSRAASPRAPATVSGNQRGLLVVLCITAAVITAGAHRPDIDDSFYLSLATHSLDHPEEPLLRYDGMFGETGLPLFQPWYRATSYELLIATLSCFTHLQPGVFYYVVFPPLFAVLVVVAHWSALKLLGGDHAVLGTAAVLLALIAWGGEHQAFGNFSFVRLFQGKAVLVAVCIPATVFSALRLARSPDLRNFTLLGLTQVASIGFTATAGVISPLTAATVLLAAPHSTGRRHKFFVCALAAQGAALVMASLFLLTHATQPAPDLLAPGGLSNLLSRSHTGLATVIGGSWMGTLALFALLAAPVLVLTPPARPTATRLALLAVLLIMNPVLPAILGLAGERLVWRSFWAVPFPLLIGLLLQRILALKPPVVRRAFAFAAGTMFFVAIGGLADVWTLETANKTELRLPGFKVDPEYRLAEIIVSETTPGSLVLAPYVVSSYIPMFSEHPRLIGVRTHYYTLLEPQGEEDVHERRRMIAVVSGWAVSSEDIRSVAQAIERRGVSMVVFRKGIRWHAEFEAELKAVGCNYLRTESVLSGRRYSLWHCGGPQDRE